MKILKDKNVLKWERKHEQVTKIDPKRQPIFVKNIIKGGRRLSSKNDTNPIEFPPTPPSRFWTLTPYPTSPPPTHPQGGELNGNPPAALLEKVFYSSSLLTIQSIQNIPHLFLSIWFNCLRPHGSCCRCSVHISLLIRIVHT